MFLRAMVRICSFGERWNVPFNSAVASLNGTFHLSPHENILTIALINIHYLYIIYYILYIIYYILYIIYYILYIIYYILYIIYNIIVWHRIIEPVRTQKNNSVLCTV